MPPGPGNSGVSKGSEEDSGTLDRFPSTKSLIIACGFKLSEFCLRKIYITVKAIQLT